MITPKSPSEVATVRTSSASTFATSNLQRDRLNRRPLPLPITNTDSLLDTIELTDITYRTRLNCEHRDAMDFYPPQYKASTSPASYFCRSDAPNWSDMVTPIIRSNRPSSTLSANSEASSPEENKSALEWVSGWTLPIMASVLGGGDDSSEEELENQPLSQWWNVCRGDHTTNAAPKAYTNTRCRAPPLTSPLADRPPFDGDSHEAKVIVKPKSTVPPVPKPLVRTAAVPDPAQESNIAALSSLAPTTVQVVHTSDSEDDSILRILSTEPLEANPKLTPTRKSSLGKLLGKLTGSHSRLSKRPEAPVRSDSSKRSGSFRRFHSKPVKRASPSTLDRLARKLENRRRDRSSQSSFDKPVAVTETETESDESSCLDATPQPMQLLDTFEQDLPRVTDWRLSNSSSDCSTISTSITLEREDVMETLQAHTAGLVVSFGSGFESTTDVIKNDIKPELREFVVSRKEVKSRIANFSASSGRKRIEV